MTRTARWCAAVIAGAAAVVVTDLPAAAAPPVVSAHTTTLFYGATAGCEAGSPEPCLTVDTVDTDYDGRPEIEICVNGVERGCTQVSPDRLSVSGRARSATLSALLVLHTYHHDGSISVRPVTVGVSFVGTGGLQRHRQTTRSPDPAGCLVRMTTTTETRPGDLSMSLDGIEHVGAATLGSHQVTRRVDC